MSQFKLLCPHTDWHLHVHACCFIILPPLKIPRIAARRAPLNRRIFFENGSLAVPPHSFVLSLSRSLSPFLSLSLSRFLISFYHALYLSSWKDFFLSFCF